VTTPDGLPPLREIIRAAGLSARRSFGQNFLLDLNLTRRIARAAGPLEGVTVVEIGPGPGGLTRALFLEGAARIVAIEKDSRFNSALQAIADIYSGRLELVGADATRFDYVSLGLAKPVRIVANLPYNVATPLLIGWLKSEPWPPWFDRMILMFQQEVADRIVAQPGSKDYGRLSVISQWRTEARILFTVPPRAFTPSPKVDSALVELIPRENPSPPCDVAALERVTAAAFGQRRKMLRSALRQISPDPETLLAGLGIEPTVRAEELQAGDFCRIAEAINESRD
jgi:16S rRNA (adenine1518-N6/adenine1519-N6)-dimethyltransferase